MTRGVDDLLADLAEAADAAAELVSLGKERWDAERPLRLAGEAIRGRFMLPLALMMILECRSVPGCALRPTAGPK